MADVSSNITETEPDIMSVEDAASILMSIAMEARMILSSPPTTTATRAATATATNTGLQSIATAALTIASPQTTNAITTTPTIPKIFEQADTYTRRILMYGAYIFRTGTTPHGSLIIKTRRRAKTRKQAILTTMRTPKPPLLPAEVRGPPGGTKIEAFANLMEEVEKILQEKEGGRREDVVQFWRGSGVELP